MPNFTSTEELYMCLIESDYKLSTDTRQIENGSLFFALKGDNFNANEFAASAIQKGCSYAIVDEEKYMSHPKIKLVRNCLEALQHLANFHRSKFQIPVLAITGSNGKTTNKELIHAVLSTKYTTLATIGNLNNHIGVPLTLLRLRKEHQFAIIEMGANHQGEIDALCRIADPNFGMITNIGKAHLEGFGGIEGVKKGKSELYRYIKSKNGILFIHKDDGVLTELAGGIPQISYGTSMDCDVTGKEFSNGEMLSFKYGTRDEKINWNTLPLIQTQIIGSYNFINCLAAVCIGWYFKVDSASILNGIETYLPNMNRSQLIHSQTNKIILDAYNANPSSMRSAIENFSKLPANNKLLLLGDMFELGEYSTDEHLKLTDLLKSLHLNNAILVGEAFFSLKESTFLKFKTTAECKAYLAENKISNTTVLIKGSRGMKMEVLQEVL